MSLFLGSSVRDTPETIKHWQEERKRRKEEEEAQAVEEEKDDSEGEFMSAFNESVLVWWPHTDSSHLPGLSWLCSLSHVSVCHSCLSVDPPSSVFNYPSVCTWYPEYINLTTSNIQFSSPVLVQTDHIKEILVSIFLPVITDLPSYITAHLTSDNTDILLIRCVFSSFLYTPLWGSTKNSIVFLDQHADKLGPTLLLGPAELTH